MTADIAAALLDPDRLRFHPYDPGAAFWRAAGDHHVDLLLMDVARAAGADAGWPEPARRGARAGAIDAIVLRTVRDHELQRVLDALAAAGVPCLLIKGAALAHQLYREPYARRRSDADLLVRAADAGRAAEVLRATGYARATETSGAYATSQMHFARSGSADHRFALDVHWRVLNTHWCELGVTYEDFAAARIPVPGLGSHAWTLCLAHALALACIHRVAHHQDSHLLLWLWDVHLLASALPPADVALFEAQASRSGTRAVCAHTLTQAAGYFATAGADALVARVQPRPGDVAEPSARFIGGGLRQVDILRSDLSGLGWRRGASLLREHLFPRMAYMRSRYSGWPAILMPAAYLHRFAAGAPKWLRRPSTRNG